MRLAYVDTEECQPPKGMSKFYKPITYGGKEAAEFLKDHLGFLHDERPAPESDRVSVDVEFDAVEDTCSSSSPAPRATLATYVARLGFADRYAGFLVSNQRYDKTSSSTVKPSLPSTRHGRSLPRDR